MGDSADNRQTVRRTKRQISIAKGRRIKQSGWQLQPRNIENRDRHARRASADLLVRARQQVLDRTTRVPTSFQGFDDRGDTAGSNNSAILVTDSQHQISLPAKLDRDEL